MGKLANKMKQKYDLKDPSQYDAAVDEITKDYQTQIGKMNAQLNPLSVVFFLSFNFK